MKMTNPVLHILIACGSGIATSSIAQDAVEKTAKKAGIRIRVTKCAFPELPYKQKEADLVLTTANIRLSLEKPSLCVMGFVSGIGEDRLEKELTGMMRRAVENYTI